MRSSTVVPAAPVTVKPGPQPSVDEVKGDEHDKLFHVVLLDDDHHTYDYVIEMLQKLFLLSAADAFQHAVEVDTTGRTIVITCERPQAEFARDQIQSYGADPRMPSSKGSMSAVLVPAGNTDVAG
jgi:ATP-dependent Clp protease adaptor protein ClpS